MAAYRSRQDHLPSRHHRRGQGQHPHQVPPLTCTRCEFDLIAELFCFEVVMSAEAQMALRTHIPNVVEGATSPQAGTGAVEDNDLTPEQYYRVRVMGEEELELLRAAASQGGLQLASLNWILASLANHGFVTISGSDRRLRAIATKAGYLAVARRPVLPDDTLSLH
jgi:hypothetical protein